MVANWVRLCGAAITAIRPIPDPPNLRGHRADAGVRTGHPELVNLGGFAAVSRPLWPLT
jgi:hypothetical protein